MVLALGIHGFLLGMNFKWPGKIFLDRSKPKALNMTLTSIPIQTTPESSLQKPKPILKKPTIVRKKQKKSKPKRVLKAPPKKMVPIPVQSQKKDRFQRPSRRKPLKKPILTLTLNKLH